MLSEVLLIFPYMCISRLCKRHKLFQDIPHNPHEHIHKWMSKGLRNKQCATALFSTRSLMRMWMKRSQIEFFGSFSAARGAPSIPAESRMSSRTEGSATLRYCTLKLRLLTYTKTHRCSLTHGTILMHTLRTLPQQMYLKIYLIFCLRLIEDFMPVCYCLSCEDFNVLTVSLFWVL